MLKEYNEAEEEKKNPETSMEFIIWKVENYCVSCKKNTANESVRKTKNRLMLLSNCAFVARKK